MVLFPSKKQEVTAGTDAHSATHDEKEPSTDPPLPCDPFEEMEIIARVNSREEMKRIWGDE